METSATNASWMVKATRGELVEADKTQFVVEQDRATLLKITAYVWVVYMAPSP